MDPNGMQVPNSLSITADGLASDVVARELNSRHPARDLTLAELQMQKHPQPISMETDAKINMHIEQLQKEFAKIPMKQQRLQYFHKLDKLLPGTLKVDRAANLMATYQRKSSTKQINSAANCVLEALYGSTKANVEQGLGSLFKTLRKRTYGKVSFLSPDDVHLLQDEYTKLAAHIYMRWGLTARQYKDARAMLLGKLNPETEDEDVKLQQQEKEKEIQEAELKEDENGEKTVKKKRKRSKAIPDALPKRTFGIEIWPAYHAVMKAVANIENDGKVTRLKNIRERREDGKFVWIQQKVNKKARMDDPIQENVV